MRCRRVSRRPASALRPGASPLPMERMSLDETLVIPSRVMLPVQHLSVSESCQKLSGSRWTSERLARRTRRVPSLGAPSVRRQRTLTGHIAWRGRVRSGVAYPLWRGRRPGVSPSSGWSRRKRPGASGGRETSDRQRSYGWASVRAGNTDGAPCRPLRGGQRRGGPIRLGARVLDQLSGLERIGLG